MTTHPTPPASPLGTGPAEAAANEPQGQGYPTDTTFSEPNPKRGKVTLTRARDLAAIVVAIKLRLDAADARFAEVGINHASESEEKNRVRNQLALVHGKLAELRAPLEEADQLLEAIVDLLDL